MKKDTPQPNTNKITAFLDNFNLPNIDPISLDQLNKAISNEEIINVINELPKNKSPPGSDGLSSGEYYMAFKEILVPHLTKMFSQATNSKTFSKTTLNYKPISLLNFDLKI